MSHRLGYWLGVLAFPTCEVTGFGHGRSYAFPGQLPWHSMERLLSGYGVATGVSLGDILGQFSQIPEECASQAAFAIHEVPA